MGHAAASAAVTHRAEDEVEGDAIAALCLRAYKALPPRSGKPVNDAAQRRWTVLAGIVLSYPSGESGSSNDGDGDTARAPRSHRVIVLSTGVKCLPYASLSAHGDLVHDQHAEVLARRGLRRWLLRALVEQCEREKEGQPVEAPVKDAKRKGRALTGGLPGPLFIPADSSSNARHGAHGAARDVTGTERRWRLRPDVGLHMYVSRAPCGDASMQLIAADAEEGSAPVGDLFAEGVAIGGRRGHGVRGRVRTKPGRGDAPPSISMSCSDKLALWRAAGLQGSLLSRYFAEPIRLESLTVGLDGLSDVESPANTAVDGSNRDSAVGANAKPRDALRRDVHAAVCGRVESVLRASEDHGACSAPSTPSLRVHTTSLPFSDSRDAALAAASATPDVTAPPAIAPHVEAFCMLLSSAGGSAPAEAHRLDANGLKKGAALPSKGKSKADAGDGSASGTNARTTPLDQSKRSALCKRDWWAAVREAEAIMRDTYPPVAPPKTYRLAKHDSTSTGISTYRAAKARARAFDLPPPAMTGPLSGQAAHGRDSGEGEMQAQIDAFLSSAAVRPPLVSRSPSVAASATGTVEDADLIPRDTDAPPRDGASSPARAPLAGWLCAAPLVDDFAP